MNSAQQQLHDEYHQQLRQEGKRFNDRKSICAHVAVKGILLGMAGGVLATFGLAQAYLSQNPLTKEHEQRFLLQSSSTTRKIPIINGLLVNWRRMLLHKRLKGIGLIMGTMGTLSGYFVSKMMYNNCIDPYIEAMRKVANRRHDAYYEAVLHPNISDAK